MNSGQLIWITGYPGAGKSSIAKELQKLLIARDIHPVMLDGDAVRSQLNADLTHTPEDRLENAWRIARLAKFLTAQGFPVIAPTVSMYALVREWLRKEVPGYKEIFVRVPKEILLKRDQKGLYSTTAQNLPGVTLAVEEPTNPDLIIENGSEDPKEIVVHAQKIIQFIMEK